MVGLAVADPPQFVQVAGHGAGRAHHHVPRVGQLVDAAEDGALGEHAVGERVGDLRRRVVGRLHPRVPVAPQLGLPVPVRRVHRVPVQRCGERGQRLAGVGHDRQPRQLAGVEARDVDVDEADARVLEGGARGGGEIAVAGADADDQVGLARRGRWRRSCPSSRRRPSPAGGRAAASPCPPGSRPPGCRSPRRTRAAPPPRRSSAPRRRPRRTGAAAAGSARRPSAMSTASGRGRPTRQTRSAKSSTGQSNASACTSCGSATVTAPVSTGSVSTRMAPSSAEGSCSGRLTRSKKRDSGRKASLTVRSAAYGASSSCSTGPATRVANVPEGSSSTGSRLTVASAAPVSMLVEPGPTDAVQAHVCRRSFCRA